MNKVLASLQQAKNNPHVFWPLAIAIALRPAVQLVFSILDVYFPGASLKNAAVEQMLEPYLKDITGVLQGYGALAAGTSGPTTPANPNPKP